MPTSIMRLSRENDEARAGLAVFGTKVDLTGQLSNLSERLLALLATASDLP